MGSAGDGRGGRPREGPGVVPPCTARPSELGRAMEDVPMTETDTDVEDAIGALQWRRSAQLAAAYGHEWAEWAYASVSRPLTDDESRELAAGGQLSIRYLVDGVVEYHELCLPPPTWRAAVACDRDRISDRARRIPGVPPGCRHTTGTGRLSWDVASDGTTTLEVHRPLHTDEMNREDRGDQVVIRAVVDVDGGVDVDMLGRFHAYHVDALPLAAAGATEEEQQRVYALLLASVSNYETEAIESSVDLAENLAEVYG